MWYLAGLTEDILMVKALLFAVENMEGGATRMRSEFENELDENMVQFVRIRDKNINFIVCQLQRFVLFLQKECFDF